MRNDQLIPFASVDGEAKGRTAAIERKERAGPPSYIDLRNP